MKLNKKSLSLLLAGAMLVALPPTLAGCRSIIEEPSHPEHAMFDVAELTLTVGETALLLVKNAGFVEVVAADPIISVEVDGAVLGITGVAPGSTELAVRADGQVIRCDIVVLAPADPGEAPAPETDADRQAALADDGIRAVAGGLALRLDEPGNIFKSSSDGLVFTVASLNAGTTLRLELPVPFASVQPGQAVEGVSLMIDNTPLNVTEACVEQCASGRIWLRILTPSTGLCRLVLPVGPFA